MIEGGLANENDLMRMACPDGLYCLVLLLGCSDFAGMVLSSELEEGLVSGVGFEMDDLVVAVVS